MVHGIALVGLEAHRVRLECTCAPGLPLVRLVGLPDTAVREAADRVRTAIQRSGLRWPQERLVVNLAPADLPKRGTSYDLPLALAILAATGQVPTGGLAEVFAFGELGLDGRTRAVSGLLPAARGALRERARALLVPSAAAPEAALVPGLTVVPVDDLGEVVDVLNGRAPARSVVPASAASRIPGPDLSDVRGQPVARRVMELAAAGGHHVLLSGPPGCGKSMLAQRLRGLLPPLDVADALDVAAVHSLAGERSPDQPLQFEPPLREPHHAVSAAALLGGGSGIPRPGEVSLAHRGVLVLDELLETPRWILDALRQPLEQGRVVLTRARARVVYPARVLLVAATNPCPCGHLGNPLRACTCRPDRIDRYRARLSGPLLDRLDLQVGLRPVDRDHLLGAPDGESTATVAGRVAAARHAAVTRWGPRALVATTAVDHVRATVRPGALRALADGLERLGRSARAFDRCLRVARTAADLAGVELVERDHVEEALAYRLPAMEAVP